MVKTVENYKFSEPKRDNLGPDVSVTDKKCSRKIQTAKYYDTIKHCFAIGKGFSTVYFSWNNQI